MYNTSWCAGDEKIGREDSVLDQESSYCWSWVRMHLGRAWDDSWGEFGGMKIYESLLEFLGVRSAALASSLQVPTTCAV